MAAPTHFLMQNNTGGLLILPGPTGVDMTWAAGETKVTGTRMERYSPEFLTKLGSCDADGVLDDPQKTDPAVDDTDFPVATIVDTARDSQAERSISGGSNTGWQVVATDSVGAMPTVVSEINTSKLDVTISGIEDGEKASLVNQGLTYQAVAEGVSGNDLTVTLEVGTETSTTTFAIDGNDVTVTLAHKNAVKASKTGVAYKGLTFEAVTAGTAGNSITITLTDPNVEQATTIFSVVGSAITIALANDAGPDIIATANSIVSDFASAPQGVKDLITVTGSGTDVFTAGVSVANLTGGAALIQATKSSLVSDFGSAPSEVTDVLNVTGSGATVLVAMATTNLAGGVDQTDFGALTTTRNQITIPAIGAETSVGDGELVLARQSDRYTITLTDPDSSKVVTLESFAF